MKDRSCEDHRRRGDGSSLRWGAARTERTSQLGERTNQSETDKKIIRQGKSFQNRTEFKSFHFELCSEGSLPRENPPS